MTSMHDFSKTKKIRSSVFTTPIIVLILVFFCICVFIVNKPMDLSTQEVKPHKSLQGISGGASLDLRDFTFTEYTKTDNGGEKSFVVSGKKLQTANPKIGIFRIGIGKVIELEKPEITFYEDNLPISIAGSKTGVVNSLNTLNKGIIFYGNVTLITEDKRTLTCNKLEWNNGRKYLLAEGNCILKAEGETIKADIIKSDIVLNDFIIVAKNRGLIKTAMRMFSGGRR